MKYGQYSLIRSRAEHYAKLYNVGFDKVMHNVTSDDDYYTAFENIDINARRQASTNKRIRAAAINKKATPEGQKLCDHCDGEGGKTHWMDFVCYKCEGKGWV